MKAAVQPHWHAPGELQQQPEQAPQQDSKRLAPTWCAHILVSAYMSTSAGSTQCDVLLLSRCTVIVQVTGSGASFVGTLLVRPEALQADLRHCVVV
jgi:hypothetical protein